MNDRFKFRVWNQKHNFYCNQLAEMCINYNGYCFDNGVCADYFEHDGFVIEQCTGLKDKNGNLIYEGDIVYDSVYENNFVVSWDNDRTGYILSANNTNHIDYLSKILIERHNLKIIGNIHEQKEQ